MKMRLLLYLFIMIAANKVEEWSFCFVLFAFLAPRPPIGGVNPK
jgi:hypothetical protein